MRIQVLTLPSQKVGDAEQYPFALVIDQAAVTSDATADSFEHFGEFAKECGAVASIAFADTVEVL